MKRGYVAQPVEPWCVRERGIDLENLAQTESIFALANGHIGMRGNLDEGDPNDIPGTYLNGVHESRPLPYAENSFGNPDIGETVLNVTDGKLMRLLVGDELFDVGHGELLDHERCLDLRAGVLYRTSTWRSPAGLVVCVRSARMVSFAQRGVAAVHYEVEAVNQDMRLVVQSELIANEDKTDGTGQADDPRQSAAMVDALEAEEPFAHGDTVLLMHRTKRSEIRLGAAMAHVVDGPEGMDFDMDVVPDFGRYTIAADVRRGQKLRVLKFIAYGWSGRRSYQSVRAQVLGSIAEARHTGWDGLIAAQRAYLDDFWERADVEIVGDDELQQAIRFAMFHCLQASARAERRAIAAKGLTGSGYDGHAFWDTESYVLPLLTYTIPGAAADALGWRFDCLPAAYERAEQLGLKGSAFPWRTITGRECSGYWPAGTAGFHVSADIADAVIRQQRAVDDEDWDRVVALPLLVGTARLWLSLGHFDHGGNFRIPGVTGPDEYSALVDDNVYTNLMAARNLRGAADAAQRFADAAGSELAVTVAEIDLWRRAADRMYVAYDEVLGIHQQSNGFTEHAVWDFENTSPDDYPLLLHAPYFDLYRKQVIKQADLVFALYSCGQYFTDEEKARNFEYYEKLTVRDSSLSAAIQAIVAAETGHLGLAYLYLREAALMDLRDLGRNTSTGLHIASLGGSWLALVAGLGGFRDQGEMYSFAPRLPKEIEKLAFRLTIRGSRLRVDVAAEQVTYTIEDGEQLTILHEGERLTIPSGSSYTRPLTPPPLRTPPQQPVGRRPTGSRPMPIGPDHDIRDLPIPPDSIPH